MKKTKIVCSVGPASNNVETLTQMALAGMNVVRINCSHADNENRLNTLAVTKETRKQTGKDICRMIWLNLDMKLKKNIEQTQ